MSALSASESRLLIFRPEHNSHEKHDVTGAFKPEAARFLKTVGEGSRVVTFNNRLSMAKRRKEVIGAIEAARDEGEEYDGVAFFCHGWMKGIQAGFTLFHVEQLARVVQSICGHSFTIVPLYCCSTGDDPQDDPIEAAGTGDGSFADRLRDELAGQGANYCRVLAHSTVAHTTKNPFALFFDGDGSTDPVNGGYAVVGRRDRKLWQAWRQALRTTDLRFRFPFMEVGEIHKELQA